MTNFLAETRESIEESGHTPADIVYIGSRDGYTCTWEEFEALADFEYDAGYGSAEIPSELEIHFADGVYMWRGEYDGSEWWYHTVPFVKPTELKPIRRIQCIERPWETLAERQVLS